MDEALEALGITKEEIALEYLKTLIERRDWLNQAAVEQNLLDGSIIPPYQFTLQDAIDAGVDWGVSGDAPDRNILSIIRNFIK